jgi:hypothetical protein
MLCNGSSMHLFIKIAESSDSPHSVIQYFYSTALAFQVRKHQVAPEIKIHSINVLSGIVMV